MKIAIIGTRGVPNNYGGFEQFAEYLSVGLVNKGHKVVVYSPKFHPYKDKYFKGVEIRRVYSPENKIGAMANFIYDWLSLKNAIQDGFDIIYEAGYQSSALSIARFNKKGFPLIITNMDGIEWMRSKWSKPVKILTKYFERLAIHYSDYLISDNIGIQEYYKNTYNVESFFIAYGADKAVFYNKKILTKYEVKEMDYFILIARLEPENNIEVILDGFVFSKSNHKFIVIGNYETNYGNFLVNKYKNDRIVFLSAIYDKNELDSLRYFSLAYLHGHSVGGTNPSLLEAMASQAFIIAHNNPFNKSVLKSNAYYFSTHEDVSNLLKSINQIIKKREIKIKNNLKEIELNYSWSKIIEQHENLFNDLIRNQNRLVI